MSPLGRIADHLEKLGRARPEQTLKWLGKTPLDYRFPELPAGRPVKLADELKTLADGQMLFVCALYYYRGNGPYNGFMGAYREYSKTFPELIGGLHVVTEEPDRPDDREHWFEEEDRAGKDGTPFRILLDEQGELRKLEPNGSPYVLALDRSGRVVMDEPDRMDGVSFWEAVSRLKA